MPRGDGTGPRGMGPMTGRAAGYCAGYAAPGFMNRIFGRGLGRVGGAGVGYGRVLAFRRGCGAFRGGRGGRRAYPRNTYAASAYQLPGMYGGRRSMYGTAPYVGMGVGKRRW